MKNLLKGLRYLMVKMCNVVLVLQPESLEWSVKLEEYVKSEFTNLGRRLNLAVCPRVKALDGQGLKDDENGRIWVLPVLKLQVTGNYTTILKSDVSA